MIRVGITGGIGSGKSMVRDLFQKHGALVFDADAEARELMENDPQVMDKLRRVLGEKAWQPNGKLDRPWIATRIFSDDELRQRVNAIVHPAVRERFLAVAAKAEADGFVMLVREAALLPSASQLDQLDVLLYVATPESVRLQRVMTRDNAVQSDVQARMRAQPSDQEYAAISDIVLKNDGSVDDLEAAVKKLWDDFNSGVYSRND